jgi:hypothetical protein
MNNLYASNDNSPSNAKGVFMETRFMKICEKVLVFLKENPSKNHLTLEGLITENVLNKDDYEFLKTKNIKYNPPSSAGPHDNYLSIFDRENEDGTSSHILYDLVDKSDPNISKVGNISSLNSFLTEWYEYPSNDKSVFIFNNEDFYFFAICYYNNEYWDQQHVMLIDFPENNKEDIKKFKDLMHANKIKYRENIAQSSIHLTAMLPSNLSMIKYLCAEILEKIFIVTPNDVINYTPNGFRFKKDNSKE